MTMPRINRYTILDYAYILIGSFLTAAGIILFTNPAQIAPGGVSGVSTILFHTFGWDISITMLLQNIPLFLIGVAIFGKEFGIKSLIGSLMLSIFSAILSHALGDAGILDMSKDISRWLCCLFGGVLCGVGIGMVMKSGANTGGTDIIAVALKQRWNIPIGQFSFAVNICIFLVGAFSLSLDIIIASTIMMFISANTLEYVVGLFNHRKLVMIISEKGEEVSEAILASERFGVTLIRGKGAYSGGDREILLTVTNNVALKRLENLVFMVDPKALFVVENTFYVSGGQFSRRN